MARVIRKTSLYVADMATAINDIKAYMMASLRKIRADVSTATSAGTSFTDPGFHNDISERTVTAANAADLPTCITLAGALAAVYEFHRVDTLACLVADATNALITAAIPSDLPTVITMANDIKAKYNAHRTQATIHPTNDATNSVATANATDLASSIALLNALKTALNAHLASGPTATSIRATAA